MLNGWMRHVSGYCAMTAFVTLACAAYKDNQLMEMTLPQGTAEG